MLAITIYTKSYCPYCANAKKLLKAKGYTFEDIDIIGNEELALQVAERSGRRTVPQIFVGEHSVGGYDDLVKIADNGKFDALVRGQ